MSTLHKRGYKESRNWADRYDSAMNQIGARIMYHNNLMGVIFQLPTDSEDRKQGIDMHVITEPIKFSYRVRQASALPYFYKGFTIRTSSQGYPSELDKVQTDTYADYLLYGIAHPENYGEVIAAVMLDLKSIGALLRKDPSLIEKATKGKGFVEFQYDAFPYPVVVGTHGFNDKWEVSCQ